jgi:hypothetical protein
MAGGWDSVKHFSNSLKRLMLPTILPVTGSSVCSISSSVKWRSVSFHRTKVNINSVVHGVET